MHKAGIQCGSPILVSRVFRHCCLAAGVPAGASLAPGVHFLLCSGQVLSRFEAHLTLFPLLVPGTAGVGQTSLSVTIPVPQD